MSDWIPRLLADGTPRYLAIVKAIAEDIRSGRLSDGEWLPPQRILAKKLGIHFTTVARGYVEAQNRGLVESKVGQGTFVTSTSVDRKPHIAFPTRPADLTMNLPPEPADPELIERMQAGAEYIASDIVSLLRYQGFGGSHVDKEAALEWLRRHSLTPSPERLFVSPGAHSALVGILTVLSSPGDVVLAERITYPGIRSIAAQLNLKLIGIEMDENGIIPEALSEACAKQKPKAIYLNPTLHNPTTMTIPNDRRREIVEVARHFNVPIIEDDAYGFIPPRGQRPTCFTSLASDLTWYIAGLSKCIGAGLRIAYVVTPNTRSAWSFASNMRASTVMASPLTVALATRWITDGTAAMILRFIRNETAERYKLAAEILPEGSFAGNPLSFSLWVQLPAQWTRTAFVEHLRTTGIGVVASDAFVVDGRAPEAVRMCLGGPVGRQQIKGALEYTAHAITEAPALASTFL